MAGGRLRSEAFAPATLEAQLTAVAAECAARPECVRVDRGADLGHGPDNATIPAMKAGARIGFPCRHLADRLHSRLKQQEAKNLLIFGSGKLISTLAQADLIDDYWLQVHPIVLGRGVSLFRDLEQQLDLALLEVKPSEEGILLLHYQPTRKAA